MHIPLLSRINDAPSTATKSSNDVAAHLTAPHKGIEELKTKEYRAIAGGPEVLNEPQ